MSVVLIIVCSLPQPSERTALHEDDDPIKLLRGVTMAFMILLSNQPNMTCEFSEKLMREFPYELFSLSATSDPITGDQTYMLVREGRLN